MMMWEESSNECEEYYSKSGSYGGGTSVCGRDVGGSFGCIEPVSHSTSNPYKAQQMLVRITDFII